MVYSLLHNSSLEQSKSLQFVLFFIGICLILGSGPLWIGIADHDYQFSLAGERENLPIAVEASARSYDQLPSEKQHIVEKAIAGESFYFEDGTKQLPRFVSKSNTYYEFNSEPTIDWTNPRSILPVVLGIVGIWFILEAIQHRRKQLGPYGH